jgi:hypothetical protein
VAAASLGDGEGETAGEGLGDERSAAVEGEPPCDVFVEWPGATAATWVSGR